MAPNDQPRRGWRRVWRDWVRPIALVLVVLSTFRSAIADWNDVPTGSMRPSIVEGDRIFVNKLAYDLKVPFTTWRLAEWGEPARGDIVVFYSPADGRRLVKRVVAVPGDTLAMRGGRLHINGQAASYAALPSGEEGALVEGVAGRQHPVLLGGGGGAAESFGPLPLPADHFFVMGDNRDHSHDSRAWGLVARQSIVGQATAVVLSVDPEERYRPRWERFFHWLP